MSRSERHAFFRAVVEAYREKPSCLHAHLDDAHQCVEEEEEEDEPEPLDYGDATGRSPWVATGFSSYIDLSDPRWIPVVAAYYRIFELMDPPGECPAPRPLGPGKAGSVVAGIRVIACSGSHDGAPCAMPIVVFPENKKQTVAPEGQAGVGAGEGEELLCKDVEEDELRGKGFRVHSCRTCGTANVVDITSCVGRGRTSLAYTNGLQPRWACNRKGQKLKRCKSCLGAPKVMTLSIRTPSQLVMHSLENPPQGTKEHSIICNAYEGKPEAWKEFDNRTSHDHPRWKFDISDEDVASFNQVSKDDLEELNKGDENARLVFPRLVCDASCDLCHNAIGDTHVFVHGLKARAVSEAAMEQRVADLHSAEAAVTTAEDANKANEAVSEAQSKIDEANAAAKPAISYAHLSCIAKGEHQPLARALHPQEALQHLGMTRDTFDTGANLKATQTETLRLNPDTHPR